MNKKIITVAAVGFIALGFFAYSSSGEKIVFDNNPAVQAMQLKNQNQLSSIMSTIKETGINPDEIKSWKATGKINPEGRKEYSFSTDGKDFAYRIWLNPDLSIYSVLYSGTVLYQDGKAVESISDNKPTEKEMQHMQAQVEKVVKNNLKTPSTAKFGGFKFNKKHGIGTVSGIVDAQNGFGATIQTPFDASFDFKNQNGAMIWASINGEKLVKD